MEWLSGDALQPETYSHLLPGVSAVVHTIGTLLADSKYKDALRRQDLAGAVDSFLTGLTGPGRNPLEERPSDYERLNRDSGLWRPFLFVTVDDVDVRSSAKSGRRVCQQ